MKQIKSGLASAVLGVLLVASSGFAANAADPFSGALPVAGYVTAFANPVPSGTTVAFDFRGTCDRGIPAQFVSATSSVTVSAGTATRSSDGFDSYGASSSWTIALPTVQASEVVTVNYILNFTSNSCDGPVSGSTSITVVPDYANLPLQTPSLDAGSDFDGGAWAALTWGDQTPYIAAEEYEYSVSGSWSSYSPVTLVALNPGEVVQFRGRGKKASGPWTSWAYGSASYCRASDPIPSVTGLTASLQGTHVLVSFNHSLQSCQSGGSLTYSAGIATQSGSIFGKKGVE
jgi:hypothetical protein